MRSVMIIRPGALGDAVLTVPLLEALFAAGVERITLLGTPASWAFLAPDVPGLEILDLDSRAWLGLFDKDAALGPEALALIGTPDAALVLLGSHGAAVERALRSVGVRRVVRAAPPRRDETVAEPTLDERRFIVASWPPEPAHAAFRLLRSLVVELGMTAGNALWPHAAMPLANHPLLRVTSQEIESVTRRLGLPARPHRGVLALHPGSGGPAKCWSAEGFAALAVAARERLRLLPVFLIGPADNERWRAIRAALPPVPVFAGIDPLALVCRPLRECVALLSIARAYVGNDSGVSHLAARACPALVLFGPSDPRVWHPLGERVAILRAPGGALDRLAVEDMIEALGFILESASFASGDGELA